MFQNKAIKIDKQKGYEKLIFLALIFIHLIPIWSFDYFPSQDGPAHIENASIIKEYHNPERSVFRKYYTFNSNFTPTWLGHLILVGLMYIVPILQAEKIFLTLYVILLPISVRYALYAIRSDTGFIAYMSFPFIYNHFIHMGFYSFSYSLSIFFFLVGYWFKNREHFTPQKVIILACLSILLYSFHVVSLVMAYVGIAIYTMWLILLDIVQDERSKKLNLSILWEVIHKRILPVLIAFLPTIILFTNFLQPRGLDLNWDKSLGEILFMLHDLLQIEALVSYQRMEFWISLALGITFWSIFLYIAISKIRHRQLDTRDGFLFIFFVYVMMFLMVPNVISKFGLVTARLNIYPFFALMIWFGAQYYRRIFKRIIVMATIGIALVFLSLHIMKYAELNDYIEEYLSGIQLIEPNTTLLPLSFSNKGHSQDGKTLAKNVKPFLHASGYIAAKRGVVEFTNYEAMSLS